MSKLPQGSDTPASDKRNWRTHPALVEWIVRTYGVRVDLDAAASGLEVAVPGASRALTPADDALAERSWAEAAGIEGRPVAFLNPPWGADTRAVPGTGRWVDRALLEVAADRLQVLFLLLPEATDTAWWWRVAERAEAAWSLGRIPYLRPDGSVGPVPPQGSTLLVLRPRVAAAAGQVLLRRLSGVVPRGGQ